MTLPDPSTPIDDALKALKLPCVQYPAVRTFGDLVAVIERGEVDDPAVLKALGKKVDNHDDTQRTRSDDPTARPALGAPSSVRPAERTEPDPSSTP